MGGYRKKVKDLVSQGSVIGESRSSGEFMSKKQIAGEALLKEDAKVNRQNFNFSHFQPNIKQSFIMQNVGYTPIVLVDGVSGTGKTTSVVAAALKKLQTGKIRQIIFIKTPSESGDDKIGYLKGGEEDKLESHFEAMRGVFTQFMTPEKLADEERMGRIVFKVPNFLQGCTFDHSIVIIDESQNNSPNTMKLIMERSGVGTFLVIMGDSNQKYAHDKRQDGFADLIKRVTFKDLEHKQIKPVNVDMVSYHRLFISDIERSYLATYVAEVYADQIADIDFLDVWSVLANERSAA